MLSVLRTHLPSDIPIAGCELTPYVLLRKPDNSITTDDIPESAPVQGYYLQCKWLRVKNEKRVAVCSVHPSEVATLQCLLCVKAKLPAAKSYHCSPQCFAAAWRNHKELHARAAATPAKDQNGNNAAPEEEELFGSGPPGSSHAARRSIIGLPNGAAYPAPAPREQRGEGGESWYEVGQGKSYTPSSDDVGHILKLECTPMDAKTRQPVAAPSTLLTSRVIPAPSPTPRRLVSIFGEGTSEIGERLIKPGTFTVVSYNVLADLYATNEMYSYCPPWALSWAYRKQNLLKELVGYRADILCLQEVQSDHYEEFFAPELKKHGYAAVYKKKTGEVSQVYTGSSYAIDGCATFFKESRFSLVKKYEVEFNKAALSLSEALGPAASKKAALNRLLKDNVALIVVLEAKEHEGADGPLPGQSKRQLLCVANTHIHANPELKDVKLWQVHTLLKGLEKIAASADIPMLVAGDFNSVPGSCPHSLLATGRVDPAHPELATDPLGILRPATKLQHQLPLVSAYGAFARVPGPNGEALRRKIDPATQEPLFTNCTRDFLGTLDYIFYTADSLQPEALLELLNEEDLRKDTGLPSPEWSSDHIALLAEFRYKPRQRR